MLGVCALLCLVPERRGAHASTPLLPGLLWAFRNRPNRLLLPVWLLANIAVYTTMAVLPFWCAAHPARASSFALTRQ